MWKIDFQSTFVFDWVSISAITFWSFQNIFQIIPPKPLLFVSICLQGQKSNRVVACPSVSCTQLYCRTKFTLQITLFYTWSYNLLFFYVFKVNYGDYKKTGVLILWISLLILRWITQKLCIIGFFPLLLFLLGFYVILLSI